MINEDNIFLFPLKDGQNFVATVDLYLLRITGEERCTV